MGYVICAGAGLAVGLALLIWALRERSLRAAADEKVLAAERKVDQLEEQRRTAAQVAETNAKQAREAEEWCQRLKDENAKLRSTLQDARERLVKCQDPRTVKELLDRQLSEVIL